MKLRISNFQSACTIGCSVACWEIINMLRCGTTADFCVRKRATVLEEGDIIINMYLCKEY